MPAQLVENIQYFDSGGLPLVGGLIYIGTVGLEPVGNLITIYADENQTTELDNPQTIGSDGFSENKIYIPASYSLRVNTVLGAQFLLDLNVGSSTGTGTTSLTSVLGTNAITAEGDASVVTELFDKEVYTLKIANTNDGTSGVTLKIDSTDELSIVKNFDQEIDAGDFTQNQVIRVAYNSTSDNFAWVDASVKTKRLTQGSDIASASSITVPDNDGNVFDITGSTTIATINGVPGTFYIFQMDSALTFTNSASLIMRGAADFNTVAGDVLEFYQLTASTVINTNIAKADGTSADSSPLTTKGDLFTFSTVDLRLAVGSNNQILVPDSVTPASGLKWTDLVVAQGDLSTSTGDMATSTTGVLVTGPGGEYGFWPTVSRTSDSNNALVSVVGTNTATGTYLQLPVSLGSTLLQRFTIGTFIGTLTARQRFVEACPPYDLGDGPVLGFLFHMVSKGSGKLLASYLAPDPPWANNGPTNIEPDYIDQKGKKLKEVTRLKKGASLEDDDPFETELIEVSCAFKNSDMGLIPHPFQGNDLSDNIIVLIDPMSKVVRNLETMKNSGDLPLDLFHDDYMRIDNTELKRGAPKGVVVHAAKMTNKLRV